MSQLYDQNLLIQFDPLGAVFLDEQINFLKIS